jgi:hypothetical protein
MATALTKLIVLIKGGGELIASLPRFIEAPHNDKNKCYEGTERRQKLLKLRVLCYHKGIDKNYGKHKIDCGEFLPKSNDNIHHNALKIDTNLTKLKLALCYTVEHSGIMWLLEVT